MFVSFDLIRVCDGTREDERVGRRRRELVVSSAQVSDWKNEARRYEGVTRKHLFVLARA